MERLDREIKILLSLKNVNIVKIIEILYTTNHIYIFEEYCKLNNRI